VARIKAWVRVRRQIRLLNRAGEAVRMAGQCKNENSITAAG